MKILIVRFSSAGDILLTSRLIKLMKKSGHRAEFLTKDKFAEQAKMAGADRVLTYGLKSLRDFIGIAEKLSAEKYDAVIDLHATLRSRLITSLIKSGKKAWYKKNPLKRRLAVLFKWYLDEKPVSVADSYIMTAAAVIPGIVLTLRKPAVPSGKVRNICLHLGARWKNKRWPHFDRLISLLSTLKGVKVTVTGVKDEVENYSQMLYHKNSRVIDLVGKTDFKQLVDIIGKSGLFIGNDTAAAHAAALKGVPALVFLGPTSKIFGFITESDFYVVENKGLMCRPCHVHGGDKCPIGTFECMKGISAEEAFSRVKKLLQRG